MSKNLSLLFICLFMGGLLSAQQVVTGKVIDEKGAPVSGVSIVQKNNRKNGTSTDAQGNYSLSVPNAGTVLVFSCVGFAAQ
jgi:hypothetical protein